MTTTTTTETTTRAELLHLFHLNRAVPTAERYAEIEEIEARWILPIVAEETERAPELSSPRQIAEAIDAYVTEDSTTPNADVDFVAEEATRTQFREVVADYAIDGLTEAQNFFPTVPRLPIKSQMAVMRVMIDEFGCGNYQQSHTRLYMNLLEELDLPTDVAEHLPHVTTGTLAFTNSFYWLASRAPAPEYFLGALGYLEASIPTGFACLAAACRRLGLRSHHYYTEHMHIDHFHKRELQVAIREYNAAAPCDFTKVWVGITVLRRLFGESFEDAVARARAVA